MAKTPEGIIKDRVKSILEEFKITPASKAGASNDGQGWYYMPVQGGFGVSGIPDFLGHAKGVFFGIETKKPGEEPKGFQLLQITEITTSGGKVFIIDGDTTLKELRRWLEVVCDC